LRQRDIAAASFATVADAILKKLIIEISDSGGMVHCRCAKFALQPDPRLNARVAARL